MNKYVESDLFRLTGRTLKRDMFRVYIHNPVFRFLVAYRLKKSKGFELLLGRILWKVNKTKRIIRLPLRCKVGYGLLIPYCAPIIINQTAEIGNNCTISQCVTIGAIGEGAAIIGNNVYIGPNVCIVGKVNVYDNVTIGSGSVVTKDTPSNSTVGGNPAKILNYNKQYSYQINYYTLHDNNK